MDGLFYDGSGFNQLLLGDDEGRGNPDHLPSNGLGQYTVISQLQAYVPCIDLCRQRDGDMNNCIVASFWCRQSTAKMNPLHNHDIAQQLKIPFN